MLQMFRPFILAALIGLSVPSSAFASCYEASVPHCVMSRGDFRDNLEFDSCKRAMENYRLEVEDYVSCLGRQLRATIESVTLETKRQAERSRRVYGEAVDNFNDRAR